MSRVVRTTYTDRRGGDDSSDDDRSTYSRSRTGAGSYRTVQRYRVTPSRVEEVDDDRHSSRLEISDRRGDRLEIDTRRSERFEGPERPRSAIDVRPRSTITERYEREPFREPERERTTQRTVVYERDRPRETEPLRPWERDSRRPWESERETDVRIEKRTTERREEPYELERFQRETEYYDRPEPPPQPIVIRQRAPEPQQIIVQEAPPPPPIVLPAPQEQGFQVIRRAEVQEVARPEPRREEDEYYFRRDVREVGPRRDEDFAVARYDRRGPRDTVSDGEYSDGSDYVVRRRVVKRESSRSRSPHHRRHLAEGALAGAGAAAILANHRNKTGNGPEHRGRQVIGGAALGAIGAEVLTRARSRYRDNRGDDEERSRSSSRHSHTKLKTALGLAAAGIAAAAAVKYAQSRNQKQDEIGRGRSRTRSASRASRRGRDDYDSDDDAPPSKHQDPKHRASQIAKAGVATAAVAGVVEHFRNKSRKRSGSRSKSRIRTGAEIAASGLAGAAVAGLYENRKAKEDREVQADIVKKERRKSRSRSRPRSTSRYSDREVDPELGMVQYGTEPVYTEHQTTTYRDYDYDQPYASGGRGESRSRSHRRRHSSSDDDRRRSRSRSRVRDIAGAALATGGAAIGINEYKKRKERKAAEREHERRRYEEEAAQPEQYYDYSDERYTPSPPHASGGSYYPTNIQFPPPPTAPAPAPAPAGYTEQTTTTAHFQEPPIAPYIPADYADQPPATNDPYGYPPPTGHNPI